MFSLRYRGGRKRPSYEYALLGAPATRVGAGPDKSKSDYTWCVVATDWGWTIEETAARLMLESAKAEENGDGYALLTAQNAAAAQTAKPRLDDRQP